MEICRTIAELRQFRAQLTGQVGFVPTMGYLHSGHINLVGKARGENDYTIVSIFVNPTQFNQLSDLATYPRDEARDLHLLAEQQVSAVFLPSAEEMYPPHFQTYINVEELSQELEGAHRPNHFRGVATVVTKLFNLVQPHRAYFGQKDAQQVIVIQRMVADLNLPVEVTVCPTVRDSDGLAQSSRNSRLSPVERAAAPIIYRALLAAKSRYLDGERNPDALKQTVKNVLEMESNAKVEYISAADTQTLVELTAPTEAPILLSLAVYFGRTRLIDNLILG